MYKESKELTARIRTEELDEVLGKEPSWLYRSGIRLLVIFILFIIIGSFFFHYPDFIKAQITITSEYPPYSVVAKTDGRIQSFLVKNKQNVKNEDYLVILENNSDANSIRKLKELFYLVNGQNTDIDYLKLNIFNLSDLGELQQPYNTFAEAVLNYQSHEDISFNKKKMSSLQLQFKLMVALIDKMKEQLKLQETQLAISQNLFNRDSILYYEKVISSLDYENAKIQLLANKSKLKNAELELSNRFIDLNKLEQQILEIDLLQEKETKQLIDEINNAYKLLKSQFIAWENLYVLKSSLTGQVLIGKFWSRNQNVKRGDNIMVIISDKKGEPFGKVLIPIENSGKVKDGQKVNIKLSSYPYTEYGMISGNIKSLSPVPDQGVYYAIVELKDGLYTNYKIEIPFNQEMSGVAEIVTEDLRLIERIFSPLLSFYHNNLQK